MEDEGTSAKEIGVVCCHNCCEDSISTPKELEELLLEIIAAVILDIFGSLGSFCNDDLRRFVNFCTGRMI